MLQTKCICIAFAQETHSNFENEVEWKGEWVGNIIFSHKSTVSAGAAILFSMNFLPVFVEHEGVV